MRKPTGQGRSTCEAKYQRGNRLGCLGSSVDFGFTGGPKDPVFPYHSPFDSYEWMEEYGDPGMGYHLTTTRLWSKLATSLSDELVLPYRIQDYAPVFRDSVDAISSTANLSSHLDLTSLNTAVDGFTQASAAFDAYSDSLADQAKQYPSNGSILSQI
ncbi:hypothetical protein BBP40_010803 [Aspergillus hancockii]|nr:hypothetical protein BBP40_010803 [Aspergillus hancockii]